VVEASEQAGALIVRATGEAKRLVADAERRAAAVRLRVETEARAAGAAAVAARAIALAAREATSPRRQRDRLVELAQALAERLLGEQLRLQPKTVVALADQVLSEARGAREVRLLAHPEDVPLLQAELERLQGASRAVEIVASSSRRRGELRVESEIGTLDAELAPQLQRLARSLREALE
jgi:flagellar biosynthesis/type III secretory pathway protein FliH